MAQEFPSIRISSNGQNGEPHLRASQWLDDGFDTFAFDVAIDEHAANVFTLSIADDRGHRDFALEVLNRCQRWIARRNEASRGERFDRVLHVHRELHDVSKPLVRADYNHARDVWQWMLRLDPDASAAVQFAALFHDIERLVTEADRRVEQFAADYQAFKDAHANAGAEITRRILTNIRIDARTIERTGELVAKHERTSGDDPDITLLNDADALSFFSLNSAGYANYFGPEQTKRKVEYTWKRMSDRARARMSGVRLRSDVRSFLP